MNPLDELVSRLENAYSGRLVSVILYGSAASPEGAADKLADFNVLCVLKDITPRELADGEPVLRWWDQLGQPSPLLLSEEETQNSSDSFPIEFGDMKERRRVLYGIDVIQDLEIDQRNYRAQVEHELRSKVLRLRQQAAKVLSEPEALLALCVESVSTFCVLGRHVLLLAGDNPGSDRRKILAHLCEKLGRSGRPLEILLDLREGKGDLGQQPVELFGEYLEFVRQMVVFVDQMVVREKQK